jgi:hypothetical protein
VVTLPPVFAHALSTALCANVSSLAVGTLRSDFGRHGCPLCSSGATPPSLALPRSQRATNALHKACRTGESILAPLQPSTLEHRSRTAILGSTHQPACRRQGGSPTKQLG